MTKQKLAVALQYDGYDAPRVTAKGNAEIAERIIATAKAHNVPLEEDPVLAGLLASVELGDCIPEMLYQAVAELLAFIYLVQEETHSPRNPLLDNREK